MMRNSIQEQKINLRKIWRTTRQGIEETIRIQASLEICAQISRWNVFQDSQVILTYLPFRAEVDLRPLLKECPQKNWIIPRIIPATHEMIFHAYVPQMLVQHPYGMEEPSPKLPIVEPKKIQLVLVPGLAYDREGWRLGYGGGYYDRFLNEFCGVSLGVTFNLLLIDHLPHDSFDLPVKCIVTEKGLIDLRD